MTARVTKNLLSGKLGLPTLSLALLGVCIALTLSATYALQRVVHERDEQRFRNAVQSTGDRIEGRLETYLGVLMAARGFIAADDEVTLGSFRRFVDGLDLRRRNPGIQGIGFSLRVPVSERKNVEARLRAEGQSGFHMWPSGPRQEWHTIAYLEPEDPRNRAAVGFDMFTDPVRREAMSRARDTGAPAASGKVTLIQEIDAHKQVGFLIYVPVYEGGGVPATVAERRQKLRGFVYAPFRMNDLLAGIFGSEEQPRVAFDIFDGNESSKALLYRSRGSAAARGARFVDDTDFQFAGQSWVVRVSSLPAFEVASSSALVPVVLLTGLAASGVLFVYSVARSREMGALRLQARLLDSMSEGVNVSDEHGVILYTNPAEDRMFGYEPGELVGKHVTVQNAYAPEENERIVREVIAHLRERGYWSGTFSNVKKDGTPFVTNAHITALEAGRRVFWVCLQEDVTERQRVEHERRELLSRERAARAEAEAANLAKDEFLAMLGHELRNPLAPMLTALELLRMRGVGERKEVNILARQLQHVVRLVDDLLDVSRITRGKISLKQQRVDVSAIVPKAVEIASPLLEGKQHRLDLDVEPGLLVRGDEVRLTQVLANLLTNAAKYTPQRGHVTVTALREEHQVVIRVRDDGTGIGPELLPHIFELFTQGQQTLERAQGGLGLGLTLVRNLVEAHGGEVMAHSEGIGRGSEFVVRLPALQESADALLPRSSRPASARAERSQRVLIVDDNHDAAEMMADLLQTAGHEVKVAHDGPGALSVAPQFEPDVALVDIGLPVMDGYELAGRLRTESAARLIAVTGYGQEQDRQRALIAGFEQHLVKPVDPDELLSAVQGSVASTA